MADLGMMFNRNELPEDTGGSYEPLPEGWYDVKITGAEVKDTKSGTGRYIKVEYTVEGDNYSGRKVWGNLNIRNDSEKAEEIGRKQLNSLMGAIGLESLGDTDELIGNDLSIKLKVRPASGGYDASNDVSGFKALAGAKVPAPVAPKAESGSKPPWSK
jgi:hypothetical protein